MERTFLNIRQHRGVVRELHAELALALGHATQLRGDCQCRVSLFISVKKAMLIALTAKHLVQANISLDGELVFTDLSVGERALALVHSTNDAALELAGSDNLDLHHRLHNNRRCLVEGFLEGAQTGESESQFGGVDSVSGTVLEDESAASHLVTSELTAVHAVAEALREETDEQVILTSCSPGGKLTFSIAGM